MRRLTADAAIFFFSAAFAILCSSTIATNNCSVKRSILAVFDRILTTVHYSAFSIAASFPCPCRIPLSYSDPE